MLVISTYSTGPFIVSSFTTYTKSSHEEGTQTFKIKTRRVTQKDTSKEKKYKLKWFTNLCVGQNNDEENTNNPLNNPLKYPFLIISPSVLFVHVRFVLI